ncbi:hypothetical protein LR48_Vigan09g168500 [Vigna angularis]|uniref:Uncharacterized protein n=1 Tax=Phaseolus angularis TaxID=3914 RepID=A0A0L9VD91_PHAAN|nr:hypothetical protein LR48_Vigan09g168500 [Vigna angularis]
MHFGDMSSQINSFKLSFNCIVSYLYSLQILLIPVYVRFVHVPLPPEAARSRSLSVPPAPCFLHRRHSPPSSPCPDVTCPPASALVRPRTTPYWERLGSDTICNAPATHRDHRLPPQITTRLSSVLCPHSHTFRENFPEGHPSQNCSKLSTLNHGVLMG